MPGRRVLESFPYEQVSRTSASNSSTDDRKALGSSIIAFGQKMPRSCSTCHRNIETVQFTFVQGVSANVTREVPCVTSE